MLENTKGGMWERMKRSQKDSHDALILGRVRIYFISKMQRDSGKLIKNDSIYIAMHGCMQQVMCITECQHTSHTWECHSHQVAIANYESFHFCVRFGGTGILDQERDNFRRISDVGRFHPKPSGLSSNHRLR